MADVPQTGLPISNFVNGTLTPNSLFIMSYPSGSGYGTGKMSANALGEGMGHDIPFASLNTSDKSLFGAINELLVISNRANKRVSGTLFAGNTSIVLADSDIHEDSYIKACSEDIILSPTSITVAEGQVTLTYPAQSANVNVGIVLKGVSGGGDSMHNYSETEQVVGEWIDGRPVYEKTVVLQSTLQGNANTWIDTNVSAEGADTIIDAILLAGNQDGVFNTVHEYVGATIGDNHFKFLCVRSTGLYIDGFIVRYAKPAT